MKRGSRYFCGLSLAASLGLAIYLVARTGVSSIFEKFQLLGWGFTILILLAGLRQGIRSIAWQVCLKKEDCRANLLRLFALRLVGNAVSDVTPAGFLLGESAKVWACSDHMEKKASAASIAVEDLIYGLASTLFISGGAALLLLDVVVPERFQLLTGGVTAFILLSVAGLGFIIVKQKCWLTPLPDRLTKLCSRWICTDTLERDIRDFEVNIHQFFQTRRMAFLCVFVLEALVHVIGTGEVFLILMTTAGHASILTAYLVEAANRLVQLAFFIPLGLGAEEGVAGATLGALGYGLAEGVSLAVIRKGRTIFWDAVGLLLAAIWSISRSEGQGITGSLRQGPERLISNADDAGLTKVVSQGIVIAHTDAILTSHH
ncbi:MAG TPA: lysylphosphatidylglycerol synthase domain-containing protein [Terriglobia bacterium]|nr:lysylphosphatidylglycerol synthase domain-containing protein [Terriglobia bacterium]